MRTPLVFPRTAQLPCLGTVLVLSGCGMVLGVDDYRVRSDGDAGAVEGAEARPGLAALPLMPARPQSELIDSCKSCVDEQCDEYRDACLAEPRCRALLECMGSDGADDGCGDPNCIFRCRDTHPESLAFEDYFGCAFGPYEFGPPSSRCKEECFGGGNWECVGDYSWDNATERTATIEVRTTLWNAIRSGPLAVLRNAEVAQCADTQIGQPVGDRACREPWRPVDEYGTAILEARTGSGIIGIRWKPGTSEVPHRYYTRPIVRNGTVDLFGYRLIVPFLADAAAHDPGLPELALDRGLVLFNAFDCLVRTRNSVVEITGDEDAKRFYWSGYGGVDTQSTGGSVGGFLNARTGSQVEITTEDTTGESRGRRTVLVAPGWVTYVDIYPLAL